MRQRLPHHEHPQILPLHDSVETGGLLRILEMPSVLAMLWNLRKYDRLR